MATANARSERQIAAANDRSEREIAASNGRNDVFVTAILNQLSTSAASLNEVLVRDVRHAEASYS